MNTPKWLGFLVAMALGGLPVGWTQRLAPEALAEARTMLQQAVEEGALAGGALWVYFQGRTVLHAVAGVCDIEDGTPWRTNTLLRIYSMTKPIVSVAALRLLEQGKFALDDPVARYLPPFAQVRVLVREKGRDRRVPPKRALTIRDLFRHTSGYSYGEGPAATYYRREGVHYHGPLEMFPPEMSLAQGAEALARIPLLHHPGERFTYGFSTDLLGRLIEVWSGQRLDGYLREALFEPLGMEDTGFVVPPAKADRFASCHTRREGRLTVVDKRTESPYLRGFKFLSGGGGLVSTAADYGRFCELLLQGGKWQGQRLLQPETVDEMFRNQLHEVPGSFRFGLGFAIDEVALGPKDRARRVRCYSWGGYASTQFWVLPEAGLAMVFVRQMIPTDNRLSDQLFQKVYEGVALP